MKQPSAERALLTEEHNHWLPDCVLLLSVCVLVLWLGLGTTQLWDQDEGYYASVAREMHERSDWIVPTFNQELFAHKPPLMFWGMMIGFEIFGVTELATRWASAIFGTGMVLLTYRLGRSLWDRKTALVSAIVLATSLMFTVVARSATADAHLGFFVLLAITIWADRAKSKLDSGSPSSGSPSWDQFPVTGRGTWFAIYLSIAFAVLSKGPIGFAFPIAILGMSTLCWPWIRGLRLEVHQMVSPKRFARATLSMRPILGAIVLLLVAGPWFWLVNDRTEGAFLNEFFGVQHFQRFARPMDNHSGPIYYYLVATLVSFFPWTSFAIPIGLHAYGAVREGSNRLAWTVIGMWILFYFAVFSVASTKLPNYIIPAYPAVALGIGSYFSSWLATSASSRNKSSQNWQIAGWSFLTAMGVTIALLTGALSSEYGRPWVDRLQLDTKLLPSISTFSWAGMLLAASGLVGLSLHRTRRRDRSLIALALGATAWVVLIWQWIIPSVDRFQTPQQIAIKYLEPLNTEVSPQDPLVVGMFRPSMVFYSRGRVNFCPDEQALEASLTADSPGLVVVNQSTEKAKQMLDQHGYRLTESMDSFPKRGAISVYRKSP